MKGILYLVSTPIGNYEDITLRAVRILSEVDYIVCEEFKEANRLLSHLNIKKNLLQINEHNETDNSLEILSLLLENKNIALISDCGTPIFSDPGLTLLNLCLQNNIHTIPIPGANSLLPALITSGFPLNEFHFCGWLSPKKNERVNELKKIKHLKYVLVIMDTPYRLKRLVSEISAFFHSNTPVALAVDISLESEKFLQGTIKQIEETVNQMNLKGEFVLIVDNRNAKLL